MLNLSVKLGTLHGSKVYLLFDVKSFLILLFFTFNDFFKRTLIIESIIA